RAAGRALDRAERRQHALPVREPPRLAARDREGHGHALRPAHARLPVTRLVALALVGLAVAAGGTRPAADPGVSSNKVVIGGTVPLSGLASAFGAVGPGARAYFD